MAVAPDEPTRTPEQCSLPGRLIGLCLDNRLIVGLLVIALVAAGVLVAPFAWNLGGIQRYPIAVDAIPDIGENQQIVFTQWVGRSPQNVEDQISYPLTVALLGIGGIKAIRSYSFFGFSSIYIIFDDRIDFYWARSRILEKLGSLPRDTLPPGVQPALGPDATALGQVFWYTLEGHDPAGNPTGGWDQEELRTIQDWYVRYWLQAADGVAEVGSIGGYVREYQVDVDPDAMRVCDVSLPQVFAAVENANIDVGAGVLELNHTEYFIRGRGFITDLGDIENSVVAVNARNVPVLVKHVARVSMGPAPRRGALDKGGAPAVGGVVAARYNANPLAVITSVKKKISATRDAMPARVLLDRQTATRQAITAYGAAHGFAAWDGTEPNHPAWLAHLRSLPRSAWPAWATISTVTVVPFYDRAGLIHETLGTLSTAIGLEIMVTVLVVLVMTAHLRSSLLISALLPLSVLMCFIGMKLFNIQANIVALSGIAIAIGTIVDMGIVLCENMLRHLDAAAAQTPRRDIIHRAASEVAPAVVTAVLTTVVSFLPVFTMTGAEGKLFSPLAYTKTLVLLASIALTLTVLPAAASLLLGRSADGTPAQRVFAAGLAITGLLIASSSIWWLGLALTAVGVYRLAEARLPPRIRRLGPRLGTILAVGLVAVLLTRAWEPLGPAHGFLRNAVFICVLTGGLLGVFILVQRAYAPLLRWFLAHKAVFLSAPLGLLILGAMIWIGVPRLFPWLPEPLAASTLARTFPGLGREFMPPLEEGSFLWMPTTMPHASIGEVLDIVALQDQAFATIPEIETAVGKIGRADTPLDPAPLSMIETVLTYKPEYRCDASGRRITYRFDRIAGSFARDAAGSLIPDPDGRPLRQWRDHIHSPDDIWREITAAAHLPGTTSAPRLQPIAARVVMLQSGMRAPMGVKITGPDLGTIERAGLQIEQFLKEVPSVEPATVIADRIVGKPYLEIIPDRLALARYGVSMRRFQEIVEIAIGGRRATTTVEGRQRFAVRVRYARELRDSLEALGRVLVPGTNGQQIPLRQLARISYARGPQVIKSENTFLVSYVVFDARPGTAEVNVVEQCQRYLQAKVDSGALPLPPGVHFTFAGSYENQLRAARTLAAILPLALLLIFVIVYTQFRQVSVTLLVFSGVGIARCGGFVLIWLYAQPWFLNFNLFGVDLQTLLQIQPINLSVAVWVGFLALFGIATDNGVIQATYIRQVLRTQRPATTTAVRAATVSAATRRARPCLMTSATTILALLPVLTSTGRGSDVMVPMAIPSFGGMLVVLVSLFFVPVLYCWREERRLTR